MKNLFQTERSNVIECLGPNILDDTTVEKKAYEGLREAASKYRCFEAELGMFPNWKKASVSAQKVRVISGNRGSHLRGRLGQRVWIVLK